MTQEQLMKVKIKYLEDRLTTMEKSLGRIHKVMAHYQMMENESEFKRHEQLWQNDKEQGFKDIDTSDTFRDSDTMVSDHELI
jgi:hypothetical protein